MAKVYLRDSKTYQNVPQYGQRALRFLYRTTAGRILLKLVIYSGFSKMIGYYYQSRFSQKKIARFIAQHNIDMSRYQPRTYLSFNDFFTRQLTDVNRQFKSNPSVAISPADAKLLIYPIVDDFNVTIKQSNYKLAQLLQNAPLSQRFNGGYCLVYRLAVEDYHRYCYVTSGTIADVKEIAGRLHTVSHFSDDYPIYTENARQYQHITNGLYHTVQMEVGALLVGKIANHPARVACKGQEKGYFSFGGSSIVVLVQRGALTIDSDILAQSQKGIETRVHYGETIGEWHA